MIDSTTRRYDGSQAKGLLDAQGRHQKWVARRIGISESYISLILSGKRPVSESLAQRIADLLGVEMWRAFAVHERTNGVHNGTPDREERIA